MKVPIKPKRPSKRDLSPQKVINIYKLLVKDRFNNYKLIDEKSHPLFFTDIDSGIINSELHPCYDHLYKCGYEQELENLKYSDYQLIAREVPVNDFTVIPQYNEDGYYTHTLISYEINDTEYQSKLDKYNNRFAIYEKQLTDYKVELDKYEQYRKSEKRRKLQEKLNKL